MAKSKYKLSCIIPVLNKGESDFDFRLNTMSKVLPRIPNWVEIIIVEQVIDKKLIKYTDIIKDKRYKKIIVNSPIFNKSWLYNIGVKNSSTNNIILSESDMDFDKGFFKHILDSIKPETKWFFCYNRIIYYNKHGGLWLDRKPEIHNTEGGFVFCKKDFYWAIGGMDENIIGIGGNDGHFIRRAEYITKDYPTINQTIHHRYHPYNSEKRTDAKVDKTHKFNKEYYYKAARYPKQMIAYLNSIQHYFGIEESIYNKQFKFDDFDITKKAQVKQFEETEITSINLSLSSLCSAKCIFCPYKERGSKVRTKIMRFETVKNIVKQIKSDKKFFNQLSKIEVGEAGDCFLNKDTIKILRYLKKHLPHIHINMFTNFNGLTNEKSKIILKEKLIDSIWMNIDSLNKQQYYETKQLDINVVLKNLLFFLDNRTKYNSKIKLSVLILPIRYYTELVRVNLDTKPINSKEHVELIKENYKEMKDKLTEILEETDDIMLSSVIFWAEREQFKDKEINYSTQTCPVLKRIIKEVWVSPSGDTYLCCLDNRFDLKTGNLNKESIKDIWFGKKRQDLINKLRNKQFKEIGYPCNTVNCCNHEGNKC